MTLILVFGGGLAFVLLLIGIVISLSEERSLIDDRFSHYIDEDFEVETTEEKKEPTPITEWLDSILERYQWGKKIRESLAQADIQLRPAEFLAMIVIVSFGLALIAWLIGGRSIISAIIGAIVGGILPRTYVRRQQKKRLTTFNNQLPDMLNLVVNGLRAGYSTMQAMEAVSKELPPPMSDEFRRVVQEMQLGLSMERALDNLHRRIPSDDLDLTITAINVQREVGGNLAEILDTISYTIRERIRIKGEIQVLTSQVMYSGKFLALLPLILMGLLWFANREYLMSFFAPGDLLCGIILLSIAGVMVLSGYIIMTRLADIEV